MPTVVVVDNQVSRGAAIRKVLDANGYETSLLNNLNDAPEKAWKSFPDAIYLAEGATGSAMETGHVGTLICTTSNAIDPPRLDALLLIALQHMSVSDSEYHKGPSSLN